MSMAGLWLACGFVALLGIVATVGVVVFHWKYPL